MGDKSQIEWTDATWNPARGCSKVSEGCRLCYAISVASRFNGKGLAYEGLTRQTPHGPEWSNIVRQIPDSLDLPLRWSKPRTIFVNSMSDLFHEQLDDEFIDSVFAVMALCPQHTFQILTKRSKRQLDYTTQTPIGRRGYIEGRAKQMAADPSTPLSKAMRCAVLAPGAVVTWPLPNVWMGVSAEDQETWDERTLDLARTDARVRFVSAEPLLGPIKARGALMGAPANRGGDLFFQPARCECGHGHAFTRCPNYGGVSQQCHHDGCSCPGFRKELGPRTGIHLVIAGGESGKPHQDVRPMHPDWARGLRDDCNACGVDFFFKQHGEWRPVAEGDIYDTTNGRAAKPPTFILNRDGTVHCFKETATEGAVTVIRVGKKSTGRVLDGRTWDELPGRPRKEVANGHDS